MNKEELKKIEEHFKNITTEEFYQNLVDCGYFKKGNRGVSILFRCDNFTARQNIILGLTRSRQF